MEGSKTKYAPAELTQRTREELRCMLATELVKDTSEMDDNLVRQLLTELQSRGDDPAFTDDGSVEAACEKFLLDTEPVHKGQKRWHQRWWLKAAAVALVLGILFFTLPATAQADDFHGIVSWWSDSAFRLFNPGKQRSVPAYAYETTHPGLQQIYDTVTELGITTPIIPRWIPDGFTLAELETLKFVEDTSIMCNLKSGEKSILFTFVTHTKDATFQHEKDENLVAIWDFAGQEHYVFVNNSEYIVTWLAEGVECTVITDCPEEDAYKMIDSIYASED